MKKILLIIFIITLFGCSNQRAIIENQNVANCMEETEKLDKHLKDERYWGNKTKISKIFPLKNRCIYEIEEREYSNKNGGTFTMATWHLYDFSKRQKLATYNVGMCFDRKDDENCLVLKNEISEKYFAMESQISKEVESNKNEKNTINRFRSIPYRLF